ncbi:MAG: ShlB/FhaC/HecB family hemolysin secretion/activation protein [Rhodoferax sp.]|nr:ShlB/FhaC/HecB family hemolysin secretion/activation protein [Rhodoferax sp.]
MTQNPLKASVEMTQAVTARLGLWLLLLTVALAMMGLAQAQTAPDAGMLRQQIEQGLSPALPMPAPLERPAPPPAMQELPGQVTVQAFQFAGNTLLQTEQLQPVVAGWLNRPLNFNQLQGAAAAVAQAYREAGWIVRAYLPRQEIQQGIVTIQIVEALFGGVHFEPDVSPRIPRHRLERWITHTQTPGQPLNAPALDRSLLLLGDLPGVTVAGSLREGTRHAESEVVLTATDKPLITGDASLDNTGSPSTGKVRLGTNMQLSSPLGLADQGSINYSHTEGSDYLRLAYSLTVR